MLPSDQNSRAGAWFVNLAWKKIIGPSFIHNQILPGHGSLPIVGFTNKI